MNYKIKKHIWYYSGLVTVSVLALSLVSLSTFDKAFQLGVIMLLSFFYVSWGLLHHYMHHDLHAKIVLEYVLMGALGVSVAFFIIG